MTRQPVTVDEIIRYLESDKRGSWGYEAALTVRLLSEAAQLWMREQENGHESQRAR